MTFICNFQVFPIPIWSWFKVVLSNCSSLLLGFFFPPQNMNFVLMRSVIGIFYSSFSSQSQMVTGWAATQVWRPPASCGNNQDFLPKSFPCAWDLVLLCINLVVWNQGVKWKWSRNDAIMTGPQSYSVSTLFGAIAVKAICFYSCS